VDKSGSKILKIKDNKNNKKASESINKNGSIFVKKDIKQK
jgi:hypothetical protein